MAQISNDELITKARSLLKPKKVMHGFTAGDVGCALVTDKGNIYVGVSIDTCCGMGFCAEHSAISSMVTHGEYRIEKIVAVTKDGILSPCGRCREFMHQISKQNVSTEVIIDKDKTIKLKDLLPLPWDAKCLSSRGP